MIKDDTAVKVHNLSKVFRIGVRETASDSLSGLLVDLIKSPFRNYRNYRSLYKFNDLERELKGSARADIIWALRDVSFTVKQGEVLGIIGRNGAGKSTLLKILTRITPPTYGSVEIHGRVSSLLEVGTGFHRELTGRENIYLNGTVLGMKKKEVDRKFDEIVEFSGVGRFLDTPVKRYSSGMAVRLAFSVAAHLEPEILIVDEVLAVGDVAFQKKCINKMQDVRKQGRTVLFVSHNMPAIAMLCTRAILLGEGGIIAEGVTHDVVSAYLTTGVGIPAVREWSDPATAPGRDIARLRSIRVISRDGSPISATDITHDVGIEMAYDVNEPGYLLLPSFCFYDEEGVLIFVSLGQDGAWYRRPCKKGRYISTAWIPGNFLAAGMVFVTGTLNTRSPDTTQFDEAQVIAFSVTDNMGVGTARGDWTGELPGVVRPLLNWSTAFIPGDSLGEQAQNVRPRKLYE